MEGIIKDFISNYGEAILSTIVTVIAGWLGKYIQNNKENVKEKLKSMIDKF